MKLSVKIFLGICVPSIIVILIISMILINKNNDTILESETQKAIQDMKGIESNIESSSNLNIKFIDLIDVISKYYKEKNIYLMYYENNNLEYQSNDNIELKNTEILNVNDDQYSSIVNQIENDYYIFVSTKLNGDNILVYVKNINSVYEIRDNLIRICVYTLIISILIIAIIAYVISKTLTKPLVRMEKEMVKLSKGDYNIHLKEGKSELGVLAKNFNSMSKEIANRNNELLDLIDSKQQFIDNLSHEMNTPLTSILGYSELMEKANLKEEQKNKYLRYIQEETRRIMDMYKKLLMLSYKKNADFEKNSVDMSYVFNEIYIALKSKLEDNHMELIINNQLKTIMGDEILISMAISNLVRNAINVSKPESKIIINAFKMNNKKYIQVIDQGSGISKENIQKITEPFYRVDKVRSRKNGGAGLGLSICKNIMDMHGGELKIESEVGKGSIFILEFP